jgi:hypothetical protein
MEPSKSFNTSSTSLLLSSTLLITNILIFNQNLSFINNIVLQTPGQAPLCVTLKWWLT